MSSVGFALAPRIYVWRGPRTRAAIAVLIPFHSITTTDAVENISRGLAKSPSAVLNPPSASAKDAGGRV